MKNKVQKLGLILNLFGTILFGVGALDKSQATWGDVGKVSKKSKCINKFAWIGLILVVIGFGIQFIAII